MAPSTVPGVSEFLLHEVVNPDGLPQAVPAVPRPPFPQLTHVSLRMSTSSFHPHQSPDPIPQTKKLRHAEVKTAGLLPSQAAPSTIHHPLSCQCFSGLSPEKSIPSGHSHCSLVSWELSQIPCLLPQSVLGSQLQGDLPVLKSGPCLDLQGPRLEAWPLLHPSLSPSLTCFA